jgi:hypothetical protein
VGRGGFRHQQHVGGFDALPAGDRGAVEGIAVGEHGFVDAAHVGGHVLHLAFGVGEPKVNELHVLVLDHLQDITRVLHRYSPVFAVELIGGG